LALCALSFYSAVEDPNRFQQSSDVAAYLGLIPRRHQSGGMSRTLGITKTGNKLTRVHLVTAALGFAAFAPECALKNWFLVLRDRVGPWRARVALARKLAIILLVMWKNEAHFESYPSNGLRPTSVS
jgi:transposase